LIFESKEVGQIQ